MNREPYTPACLVAQVYVWRVQHQNSSFDDCPRSHYRVLPFTLPLSLNESPVKAFQDVVPGFSSSSKDVATLLKGLISLLFKGGTIVTSLSEYWVYFKLGLAIDFCIPVFSKKSTSLQLSTDGVCRRVSHLGLRYHFTRCRLPSQCSTSFIWGFTGWISALLSCV